MTSPVATILVPTHDHGPTLRASVASALRQTVSDIEVFIVGDGVPEEARDVVYELVNSDERVRFLDNPKGPGRGETHRHRALQTAHGRIVCYLSDDDLYLPRHVEIMSGLLEDADFAHALAASVNVDGTLHALTADLAIPAYRKELMSGRNRIPLSAGAHALAAYRSLPEGWTTTPEGMPPDLYLWQKLLARPDCKFRSGDELSALVFPSEDRSGWTMSLRYLELQQWLRKIADPGALKRVDEKFLKKRASDAAVWEARWLDATVQNPSGPLHSAMLQVFFPNADGHNERDSFRQPVRLGAWQTISVTIPCPGPEASIRIDPADEPCLIQVAEIKVLGPDGKALWQLTVENSGDLGIDGTATLISRGAVLEILSHGPDPRLLLPPIECGTSREPLRLEFRVKLEAHIDQASGMISRFLRARAAKRSGGDRVD